MRRGIAVSQVGPEHAPVILIAKDMRRVKRELAKHITDWCKTRADEKAHSFRFSRRTERGWEFLCVTYCWGRGTDLVSGDQWYLVTRNVPCYI